MPMPTPVSVLSEGNGGAMLVSAGKGGAVSVPGTTPWLARFECEGRGGGDGIGTDAVPGDLAGRPGWPWWRWLP